MKSLNDIIWNKDMDLEEDKLAAFPPEHGIYSSCSKPPKPPKLSMVPGENKCDVPW